jgi:hypothetical protein
MSMSSMLPPCVVGPCGCDDRLCVPDDSVVSTIKDRLRPQFGAYRPFIEPISKGGSESTPVSRLRSAEAGKDREGAREARRKIE